MKPELDVPKSTEWQKTNQEYMKPELDVPKSTMTKKKKI